MAGGGACSRETTILGDLRVLVVAPTGRDAALLIGELSRAGMTAIALDGIGDLLRRVRTEICGCMLVAEEALSGSAIGEMAKVLEEQPPWSDIPVLVLTSSGRETAASLGFEQERMSLVNVTLLERPIRPKTLTSAVLAALRARRRQYQVRDSLLETDRALSALQVSEEQNRLMLQSTRDCIQLLDLQGNLLSMNKEGQERLGIADFEGVRGTCWVDLWTGDRPEEADRAVQAAKSTGEGRFEGQFLTPKGEVTWWDVSLTLVIDREQRVRHLLAVAREVTSRKRAEQALIQSEKLAAVGRLAASISHEINNPLEAVTNLLYLTALQPDLPAEAKSYVAMAESELARVSQIVGQTLRFHRQSTRPRAICPEELLEPVLALYQGRLGNAGISVERRYRNGGRVTCSEGDIRQVLNNLVGNAIDAMKNGGRLLIRGQSATDWKTGRAGERITVADTGYGMDATTKMRVFEAFYTTKGIHGTGLGLWISHGIVQKHEGVLRLRSRGQEHGGGTMFCLFLPAELSTAEVEGAAEAT